MVAPIREKERKAEERKGRDRKGKERKDGSSPINGDNIWG